MKKLMILALLLSITSAATAEISVRVYLADGNTPLEYQDIMVGTRLTFIADSNLAEYWYGGALVIEGVDMQNRGVLYGRGFDGFEYPGSVILPAAGDFAVVWDTVFPGVGFEMYGGEEPNVGDWFIFDYNAIDIGDCNVTFYDFDISTTVPVDTLILHHVRTRDFDNSTIVDFGDFAILGSYWRRTDCAGSGDCGGTDLNVDGKVDANDLDLFIDYFLEETQ